MQQLTSLGFPGPQDPLHLPTLEQARSQGESISTPQGEYIVWKSPTGAQIWFEISPSGEYLGYLPYFSGSSCMDVGITDWQQYKESNPLDGAASGWAGADEIYEENGQPEISGEYPIVFNLPDFSLWSDRPLPLLVHARLAGFATRCMAVVDEESLDELNLLDDFPMAEEAFFPASTQDGLNLLSGRILDTALLTNELTGQPFYWAWVRTFGGELDVLISPEDLTGELLPDGFLQAEVWLSGRVVKLQE